MFCCIQVGFLPPSRCSFQQRSEEEGIEKNKSWAKKWDRNGKFLPSRIKREIALAGRGSLHHSSTSDVEISSWSPHPSIHVSDVRECLSHAQRVQRFKSCTGDKSSVPLYREPAGNWASLVAYVDKRLCELLLTLALMGSEIAFRERCGEDGYELIYVKSPNGDLKPLASRINSSKGNYPKSTLRVVERYLKQVFLPQGFPESVHPDYVPYQIWDTAFASTILGTLTTHSVMQGVGVGESAATPLAAAITWILKDGTGMVGRIVFAWWNGPELDAQCKKWRLFADAANDLAMGMELSIPYFTPYSTAILCASSVTKSLVGVAGGATRAAITQHQALTNNLADVSAKDSSQETCVNLVASLVGICLLSYTNVSSFLALYYAILVAVHIYANYSAVRALRFNTFNEDRLALVIDNYLKTSAILSPELVNKRESLLLFQRPSKKLCGFDIVIGKSIKTLLDSRRHKSDGSSVIRAASKDSLGKKYLILLSQEDKTIYVVLAKNVEGFDILEAYFNAFLLGHSSSERSSKVSRKQDSFARWTKLLNNSEWTGERHVLTVGRWRGYW